MFEKKKDEGYYTGYGEGKATAYTLIHNVIEGHKNEDPKAVLIAIKAICYYNLLDNPYHSHVPVHRFIPKEP